MLAAAGRRIDDLVVGMVERLGQQSGDVVVDRRVVGKGAFSPDPHELGQPQLGKVLRDSCRSGPDDLREMSDRRFALQERPENLYARRIGQHPEPVACEADLFVSRHLQRSSAHLRICMHVHTF